MKPFNLEAAKAGKPLVTRGGETVKFIAVEPDAQEDTQLLVLRNGRVLPLYTNGKYFDVGSNERDVFMAPEKVTSWLNCYETGEVMGYPSKEEADRRASGFRIGEAQPFTYTLE
jgi:hypothetical protein